VGARENPQTNAVQISFIIFGAVTAVGMSAYAILRIANRQAVAANAYKKAMARKMREDRLMELLGKR